MTEVDHTLDSLVQDFEVEAGGTGVVARGGAGGRGRGGGRGPSRGGSLPRGRGRGTGRGSPSSSSASSGSSSSSSSAGSSGSSSSSSSGAGPAGAGANAAAAGGAAGTEEMTTLWAQAGGAQCMRGRMPVGKLTASFDPPKKIAYCQQHRQCKIFTPTSTPWENLEEWIRRGVPEPRGLAGIERDVYKKRHVAVWDSTKNCCK